MTAFDIFINIFYFLFCIILVFGLPAYLLFFRNKPRRLPNIPGESISITAKCPVCGSDRQLAANDKCGKCGVTILTRLGIAQHGETAREKTATAPQGLSNSTFLFTKAIRFYKGRFFRLAVPGLISSVVTCIIFGILWYLAALRVGEESYVDIFSDVLNGSLPLGLLFVGAAALLFLMFWCQLAFLCAHVDEQLRLSWIIKRLCSYMSLCLLYLAIVTVGGIFFIVPGILFAIRHVLAASIFVAENENPVGAILKSKAYMKGRFAEVVPKIFALVLVAVVALYSSLIFSIPETTREAPLPILIPLMALPLVIFGHFACTYLFVMYQELKAAPSLTTRTAHEEVALPPDEASTENEPLRTAWALYKEQAIDLTKIQIVIYSAYTLPAIGSWFFFRILFQVYDKIFPGGYEWFHIPSLGESIMMIITLILCLADAVTLLAIYYLSTVYGSLAITFAVSDKSMGIMEAFRKSRLRLAPYILISLRRDFLIYLGSIFYLPGLLFRTQYAFVPFIFALEGEEGKDALKKSSQSVMISQSNFSKILLVEFLKSLRGIGELLTPIASLSVFAPILVFSGLVLVFFIAVFSLIGIPIGIYVKMFSSAMVTTLFASFIALPLFCLLFFLPNISMIYYFQLYKRGKQEGSKTEGSALESGNSQTLKPLNRKDTKSDKQDGRV